ncbi:MAG: SdrD B-like domain-containing protein, partial [Candidatus Methylacidiphilales bacterium]
MKNSFFNLKLAIKTQYLITGLLLVLANIANAQYLFQITGSSNLASVNTGSTFVYTINYSTAGNTTSGQNVVATINLPTNVAPITNSPFSNSISFPTSQVTSATYNSSSNTVTITYINPLPAGAAGQIQLSLRYSNGNTPNGYAPDIFTKVTFSNALSVSPTYSDTINVNALAANNFAVSKVKNSGGAINDLTIYRLNISNSGSSSAALTLTNPILVDTLAAGVEFVEATSFSGSNAPVYNPSNRTITWTWTSGLFNTNYSSSAYISVKYPNSSFALGNTVCNQAYLAGSIPILPLGNSALSTKNGNVCFGLAAPSAAAVCSGGGITSATASWLNKHVLSGTSGNSFSNGWSNTGNTQLDSVILTYTIDKSVDVNTISIGKLVDGLARTSRDTVQLRYKTNLNSTYTLKGTYIVTNDLSVSITLPTGEYLTDVNFVIYGDLPIGGSQSLTYSGNVRSTALGAKDGSAIVEGVTYNTSFPGDDGTLITNNSTGKYYYNGIATNYSNCNGVAEIFIPKPVFNTPNKSITNSSSNLRASDTINYRFRIQLGGNVNAQNVIVYDTLDARLNFVAGSGSVVINSVTINPTVNGNILIWNLGTLNPSATYTINFKAEIKPGTPANTIPNKIYISSSNALFPNGVNSSTNVTVVTNIALVAYKGQNGCDTSFVYYPTNATTQEGGLVNYKITVKNQGNIDAKNLTLIDVFPFIGDTRGSQWFPNLVGPVTLSDPNSTVYYNTVSNICYADFVPAVNMPSCNAPVWTLTPPMDITSVKAIKIVRNANLPALDSIVFSWPMRVPIGTPSNVIMNNTIYYQVSRADMAGTTGRLLPAAPNQVGMVTSCAPVLGSIGNYVWFDANKNGLQDEAAANGINGVKIYLYGTGPDSVMGGGDDVLIDSTFSANDFNGNPGYYKFIELKSGKYYVNFQTDYSEFLVTPNSNQASQINGNSDVAVGTGNSGLVTINTGATGIDKDNNTIDAGFYIKGSLGNYVWFDDNKNGLQDEPASNGINGQKVYLLKNTSGSTYVIIDSTITANDVLGNPGYYNFIIDVVGTYKVQFPTGISTKVLTNQNSSSGVNGNSDPNTSTGLSNAIVMNLIGGGINQHNPTIDAGYKCNVVTPTINGNGTGNGGGRCEPRQRQPMGGKSGDKLPRGDLAHVNRRRCPKH